MTLLPSPNIAAIPHRALDDLLERTDREVIAPARCAGAVLNHVGTSQRPTAPIVYDGPSGTWLLTDPARDPTARAGDGRIPVPAEQERLLRSLWNAGVRCDLLWLAHELPHAALSDREVARLVPPPDDGAGARRLRSAIARVLPLTASALWLATLDPIILGGLVHAELDAVAWVELCRWSW